MFERMRLLPGARVVEANVSRRRCMKHVLHMTSVVWQFTCISDDTSHVQSFVSRMTVICQSYDNSHMFHMTSHMYNSHVCSLSDLKAWKNAFVSRRSRRRSRCFTARTSACRSCWNAQGVWINKFGYQKIRFFAWSQNAFFGLSFR